MQRPQLRILAVVAHLTGSLPGLAPELVRGGVLRELLSLVQHPVFASRDADKAEESSDDNMVEQFCDAPISAEYTARVMQMVVVMRACAKQLPEVQP